MSYRLRLLAFALGTLGLLLCLNIAFSALNTIARLDVVEAERDRWQRPTATIQALDLKPGAVVVDLGCGSGYFTLKLGAVVGDGGRVVAEDIRRESLVFLWIRSVLRHERNISIIRGHPNDPHLPPRVNSVLIVNTYHEFTDSGAMLLHVYRSLLPSGRVVIVDRAPGSDSNSAAEPARHEISADQVESDLRQAKFEVLDRQNHFIDSDSDPDHESWWLIVACKH